MVKQKVLTAQIAKREDVTGDLFKLWLDLGKTQEQFTFKAGQYCTIGLNNIWRPYSIASAPHEKYIELFVELVLPPEGNLTPILHKLIAGDTVLLLPKAKGIFTFEPQFKNQVMVATVTGIAPFMSILRDFFYRSLRFKLAKNEVHTRFFVLQGASYCDEFGYYDELFNLEATCPLCDMQVTYVPTISRPEEVRNATWPHQETGRVNTLVESFVQGARLKPDRTIVYACGHPGMIEDVKKRLAPQGWKVKEERYWK